MKLFLTFLAAIFCLQTFSQTEEDRKIVYGTTIKRDAKECYITKVRASQPICYKDVMVELQASSKFDNSGFVKIFIRDIKTNYVLYHKTFNNTRLCLFKNGALMVNDLAGDSYVNIFKNEENVKNCIVQEAGSPAGDWFQ